MEFPPKRRLAVAWTGVGASVGAVCWAAMPWLQFATYGSRPYIGTGYDIGTLTGLALLVGGVAGVRAVVDDRLGRLGRAAVGTTAVGLCCLLLLAADSVAAYVQAGFVPVPATGEDPAGLVRTWLTLAGYALLAGGTGAVGVVLRGLPEPPTVTAALCLLAPVGFVGLLLVDAVLPLSVRLLVVRTAAFLVPVGAAWVAVGAFVWRRGHRASGSE